MSRVRFGIVRYASVADAIVRALGVDPAPECRIEHGRFFLVFRRLGATEWPTERRMGFALEAARVARDMFAAASSATVRARATRAIVVVIEDATTARGCAVTSRWECVVPRDAR